MARRLPPLAALRAFEAAARHGSFKVAAGELAVTPAAVSHQIRALEDHLGCALFVRHTRRIALTAAGERLYPRLRAGFDAMAEAIADTIGTAARPCVTISATTAFTARWLIPRVERFRQRAPGIELRFVASEAVVDLDASDIDIAVRYGTGPYPGFRVDPLFDDVFAPLANPLILEGCGDPVAERPLIAFDWRRSHPDNPTWARWFAASGRSDAGAAARLRFSEESHAIRAAVAGQGIVMASVALVEDEIAAGHLVEVCGPRIAGFRYHVLTRAHPRAEVAATVAWLLSESGPGIRIDHAE